METPKTATVSYAAVNIKNQTGRPFLLPGLIKLLRSICTPRARHPLHLSSRLSIFFLLYLLRI